MALFGSISSPAISSPVITGNTNFDSGTLFVDSVNDRVGIGGTSPTNTLDVNGIVTRQNRFWTGGTGGATASSNVNAETQYMWAGASARGSWSKSSAVGGIQYTIFNTGSNNNFLVWDILLGPSYTFSWYIIYNNHADSGTRSAAAQYSLDGGSNWTTAGSVTFGSSGGSLIEGTLTFADNRNGRHVKFRTYWTDGASGNGLIGISRVAFTTTGGDLTIIKSLG